MVKKEWNDYDHRKRGRRRRPYCAHIKGEKCYSRQRRNIMGGKSDAYKNLAAMEKEESSATETLPPYILCYILNGISTFAALYSLAHRHTFIFSSWIKGQWGEEVEGENIRQVSFPPRNRLTRFPPPFHFVSTSRTATTESHLYCRNAYYCRNERTNGGANT